MHFYHIIAAFLILLISNVMAVAQYPSIALSTSVNYSSGDYGTNRNISVGYVPFTLQVSPIEALQLDLTVPFIWQTGQGVILTGGGVVVRPGESETTQSGLGDILLKGSYTLLKEQPILPKIVGSFQLKFPTADDDRGLGTGEYDETIGLGLTKTFVERLITYLDLSYTFIGSPPTQVLNNSFGWSVGAAYKPLTPQLWLFAFLSGSTAISPGTADPLDLRFGAFYSLTDALSLTGSFSTGLTNGSPDYGLTGGVTFRFYNVGRGKTAMLRATRSSSAPQTMRLAALQR